MDRTTLETSKLNSTSDNTPIQSVLRKNTTFSPDKVRRLEAVYSMHRYPSREIRQELADEFNFPERKIKIWFQNRRQKEKRERLMKTASALAPSSTLLRRSSLTATPPCETLTSPILKATCTSYNQHQLTRQYSVHSDSNTNTLPKCMSPCCKPLMSPECLQRDSTWSTSPYTYGAMFSTASPVWHSPHVAYPYVGFNGYHPRTHYFNDHQSLRSSPQDGGTTLQGKHLIGLPMPLNL